MIYRLFFLFSLLAAGTAQAQNTLGKVQPAPAAPPVSSPLTLTQALQTGLGQSLFLQSATLELERQRALSRTGYDLPRTVVDYQYGQISGSLADQSLNVIQQTAFPTLYGAQRKLLEGQATSAEQRLRLQRRELNRAIRTSYYELLTLHRRSALLRRQDSLYRRAARAAEVRYRTGETNRLEQVSAAARAQELQNRLLTVLTEVRVRQQQLGLLLGTPGPVLIDTTTSPVAVLSPADTAGISPDTNPTLAVLQQEVAVSEQQTRVERLRRLPDLRLGYFNQTIDKRRGFQVAQAGVALPLLGGAQRGRIAAAKVAEQAATAQLSYAGLQLSTQLSGLRQQLTRARASLEYYQQTALPQARLILDAANKSFRAGDIDYVEFVVNTQPAWDLQAAYLDQITQYNTLVISLQALAGTDN
ncbi:TolC family protein [Hymenobacter psychrotolerans]|uniref:Cobalt-zinc-cadmium resistance protein CzcA n=1 Tax=Hymenobacter psychrotolerans DSM 18569 TaxID=1121959 RepID=A0A1M7GP71_9BACT|nr:TolC family protein [Hymenobacter psychrotolerans]SHM18182.1 cobalt-zinc-cadmium resistance protein CzcA [Hymenobacter psychrotolerans DSM 18569]